MGLCKFSKSLCISILNFKFAFLGQKNTKPPQNGQERHPIGGYLKTIKYFNAKETKKLDMCFLYLVIFIFIF